MVTSTYSGPGYIIIDDFLSLEHQALVWNYIQAEKFEYAHSKRWVKAFRLTDGEPLWGPVYLSDTYEPDTQSTVYPSGQGIDLVIQAVKQLVLSCIDLIGEQYKDWAYFFARSYLYPANTGLSWHRDNEHNACGAFTYYAHPTWNPQWGGEFLLSPYETREVRYPQSPLYNSESRYLGSALDNSFEQKVLLEHSVGTYIVPKPNRLIIITSGIIHAIKKVDPAAGDHVRATIQGFFQDPVGILKKK